MLVVDMEKAGRVLWTLLDMSIAPALCQVANSFSMIQFRVHKAEMGSSLPLVVCVTQPGSLTWQLLQSCVLDWEKDGWK